jgi:hypothetical protein
MKKIASLLILALLSLVSSFTITYAQVVTLTTRENSIKALYLNCASEMRISVSNYAPEKVSFRAIGAELMLGDKKGDITLVPKAAKVTLNILYEDKIFATENFAVRLLPKPDIQVFAKNKLLFEEGASFDKELLELIHVRVIANEDIKEVIPQDARYRIGDFEVYLERKELKVGELITSKDESVDLSTLMKSAQSGDRLVVALKGSVKRLNFKNEIEEVKVGNSVFKFMIH